MTDDLAAVFHEELSELVESLERALLDLKSQPEDLGLINQVFRDLHTIKGSGAMFGYTTLAGFIHDFETAFDKVRSGAQSVTPELIRLCLAARDLIPALLDDEPDPQDQRGEILSALRAETSGALPDALPAAPLDAGPTPARLSFHLKGKALALGARPDLVLKELITLGATEIVADISALPALADMDADMCYMAWTMSLPASVTEDDLEDVFFFVDADWQLHRAPPIAAPAPQVVADISQSAAQAPAQPAASPAPQPKTIPSAPGAEAEGTGRNSAPPKENASSGEGMATVRVPAARLDTLMDTVGELVTVEARLTDLARASGDPALVSTAELIAQLATQLRDATIVMRMVPLRSIIARFRRLILNLSETLGKPVDFVVIGEETELDKTMIEKLADPLVHILRNAIDHGMETAEERQKTPKSTTGRIELSAIHAGGEVLIRVRDDGRGMSPDRIRAKAVERGLIAPDAQLTDGQIFSMIFEPGFSTADVVTELSGRGVGMDVVRRTIETLRGTIDVESRLGIGTTVTMRLPLTLAIIDGLMIKVGEETYTLPLSAVKEIIELPKDKVIASETDDFLDIRGKFVPFLRLRNLLSCSAPEPDSQNVVIVEAGDGCVGLVVDRIIGTSQTVIKQMSKLHAGARAISGATILSDGSVALIIDVQHLVSAASPHPKLARELAA
ncbi:MAG: chemotaxis protein CheA [Roseinatronobacter sp.]|nr:chemotaxis protein CheA [Roseinatronobacter sp.]